MLGKEIQKLRRSRGLSQEKLAEQMEVSRQAISKWESGAAVPEVEKLIQLARLFGVSVDRLLGLESSEQEAPPDALPGAAAPDSPSEDTPAGAAPPTAGRCSEGQATEPKPVAPDSLSNDMPAGANPPTAGRCSEGQATELGTAAPDSLSDEMPAGATPPEPQTAAPGSLPNEMPAGATPPPGVTGEQFRVLEGMVADLAREQHLRERRQRRRGIIKGALLLCVLAAAAMGAWSKISSVEGQVRGLWNGLDNLSRNLTSQVNSIAGQVREGLEEQASLAADYQIVLLEADLEARTATFRLSVTPKTWKEGMGVQFQLAQDGQTTLLDAAPGEGTSFQAEAVVPWGGEAILSVVFTDPESGQRQTQVLDSIRDLEVNLALDVSSGFYGTVSVPGDGTLRFRGKVELWCDFYPTYIDGVLLAENYPVSARAVVLVDGAEVDSAPVELVNNAIGDEGDWNSSTTLDFNREYTLSPGQTLQLVVEVTDALGQTTRQVSQTYAADAQGTIQPAD